LRGEDDAYGAHRLIGGVAHDQSAEDGVGLPELGRRFPKLLPPSELTDDILGRAAYFIILQIQEEQFDLEASDPSIRPDPWQNVPASSSPLLARMTEEQLRIAFPNRTPTVRIPADSEDTLATPAVLSERRELAQHRLIVRKVLRRRK
jgi:hypothetical protein